MSVGAENTTKSPPSRDPEGSNEPTNGISHDLIEEIIKAYLGTLHEQISKLSQPLNQLIQENSARNYSTAITCFQQRQSRHSPSHETETSRAVPVREISNTGFRATTV